MLSIIKFSKLISARNLALLSVSLFLAVAAPFVSAGSVSASMSLQHSCPDLHVCFYEHKEFGGDSRKVAILSAPVCVSAGFLANKVSSVVNNTHRHIQYHWNSGCAGSPACYFNDGPHSYRENLTQNYWQGQEGCQHYPVNDFMESALVY